MSSQSTAAELFEVALIRLGFGIKTHAMPPGATVGDLLRQAGAEAKDQVILIEGERAEETQILQPGTEVFLVPRARNALGALAARAAAEDALYRKAAALFDPEEIRRRKASCEEGYTIEQVLQHLKSLGTP
jgi:sulfur carrier protein ThiS